jgi:hypothetical protein
MTDTIPNGAERKAVIRKIAFANRRDQENKDELSKEKQL